MMTGDDPAAFVDHKDGDTLNNRWGNLRLATNGENLCNAKLRSDNSTGVKGVCLVVKGNYRRFRATIAKDKTHYRLGDFRSLEEAASGHWKKAPRTARCLCAVIIGNSRNGFIRYFSKQISRRRRRRSP
jgi:hypothetical protein